MSTAIVVIDENVVLIIGRVVHGSIEEGA
jgi:hypothetical protein